MKRLLSLLAFALTVFAIPTSAHDVQARICAVTWTPHHHCEPVYDPYLEIDTWHCDVIWIPTKICVVVNVPHEHRTETPEERNNRVLREAASCLLGKVNDAIASCTVTGPEWPDNSGYSSVCMEVTYPVTSGFLETLRTDHVATGDLIVGVIGDYGEYDHETGQITIDINYHFAHPEAGGNRNHETNGTIAHEVVHKHKWEVDETDGDMDGDGDFDHDDELITENVAQDILEEVFNTDQYPGGTCQIRWDQLDVIIWGNGD